MIFEASPSGSEKVNEPTKSENLEPPTLADVKEHQKLIGDKNRMACKRVWSDESTWSKWMSQTYQMHPAIRELYVIKVKRALKKRKERQAVKHEQSRTAAP